MKDADTPALGPFRALLPLGIGGAVVAWMVQDAVVQEGGWTTLEGALTVTGWPVALLAVLFFVLLRDLGYVLRLRALSGGDLGWRQAIETTVVWEFASAITPGVVGGGAVAIWGLTRQGLSAGRSTAVVFSTTLMDQMFYVLTVPPLLWVFGEAVRPAGLGAEFGWGVFWASWGLMLLLGALIALGLFLAPLTTRIALRRLATVRVLRRWMRTLIRYADDLATSSEAMRQLPASRWVGALVATWMSWTARFLTLVAVMGMVVAPWGDLNAGLIVARQLVMWVFLLISPTPGSSGVAEWLLGVFFAEEFALAASPLSPAITMLVWRMATHFLYLLIGVLVIPGWLRRTRPRKTAPMAEL